MNILSLVKQTGVEPRKVSNTNGGEYASPCPWCGGNDRFRVWPEEGNGGRYWCRQCERKGDAIQFLRDYHKMSYPDACKVLGEIPKRGKLNTPHKRSEWTPKPEYTVNPLWQEKATAFVEWCETRLWSPQGKDILTFLTEERLLTEETIRTFHLGFNPKTIYRMKSSWGIPETDDKKNLWLPSGPVIPMFEGDHVSQIRIRIPEDQRRNDMPYYLVPESSSDPVLIGECRNVVIIVESALDAILTHQETEGFASVLCLGSVSYRPTEQAWKALHEARIVLNVLDSDDAGGKQTWTWWRENLPKAQRWRVPDSKGKDITEACVNGMNLREWIFTGALGDEHSIDAWDERVAIMEFEGGMTRKDAERKAFWDVKGWKTST